MDYQQTAAGLARLGRHGDSQLLHVSPEELRGIAAFGELTYNPDTGLPEAFSLGKTLKIVLPIAAAIFAPYLLPAMAPALASGLGAGLATTAVTGDFKRGLVAGVMGAGVGSAFGAAGKAAAGSAASEGLAAGASEAVGAGIGSSTGIGVAGIGSEVMTQSPSITQALMSSGASGSTASGVAAGGYGSLGSYTAAPYTESDAFMGQLSKSSTVLPVVMGAGQLSQWDMQDQAKKMREKQEEESEEERRKAWENLQRGYSVAQPFAQSGLSPYRSGMSFNTPPPQYMAEGGQVEPIDYGGQYPWFYNTFGNRTGAAAGRQGIDPVTIQKNLRGIHSVAPQRQYMPGFNPEFRYFQDDLENVQQARPTYANAWTSMYRASPIQMAVQGNPEPWMQRIPQQPYFESILGRTVQLPPVQDQVTQNVREDKAKNMAAGGEVTLNSSRGQSQIAGGGIANVPTEFTQPQQPQPQELQMVAMALLGRSQNAEQVIEGFIGKYGPEVFRTVREMVLSSVNPNAQTEGKVTGPGGGMDDQVAGTVGDQQGVAVSPGEYIVPADVVSGLGDGNTDSGAQQLDQMMQNVRMARGGSVQQPQRIDPRRLMPA